MAVAMDEKLILLGHGSGGLLSHELIEKVFLRHLGNALLTPLEDSALFESAERLLAFTTDSYVVKPIFFPGGDIGRLAVCGTVNDLSMRGARPLHLSAGFIIEEGLPIDDLETIVASMHAAADEAGVTIVCGDTKVVEKHAADKLFINTSGVGAVPKNVSVSVSNAQPGDSVIVSGTVGDHGVTILSQRQGLQFKSLTKSDVAPLNGLVQEMLAACPGIHAMRDPTRGGLATTLNEIAKSSKVGIEIEEDRIPVSDAVERACEMLGLDPLYLANEGKLVVLVAKEQTEHLLEVMRNHVYGRAAAVIGQVTSERPGRVVMRNPFGIRRTIEILASDQFPRIC
ncbi:MAG TPA: hydrogenase expression/formation protein HypE [Syntrophorhabdales bacterium]|nr:hydrogenase expression/formation protein HypE [Syntrophorhabdales bacterium]